MRRFLAVSAAPIAMIIGACTTTPGQEAERAAAEADQVEGANHSSNYFCDIMPSSAWEIGQLFYLTADGSRKQLEDYSEYYAPLATTGSLLTFDVDSQTANVKNGKVMVATQLFEFFNISGGGDRTVKYNVRMGTRGESLSVLPIGRFANRVIGGKNIQEVVKESLPDWRSTLDENIRPPLLVIDSVSRAREIDYVIERVVEAGVGAEVDLAAVTAQLEASAGFSARMSGDTRITAKRVFDEPVAVCVSYSQIRTADAEESSGDAGELTIGPVTAPIDFADVGAPPTK
jgi:hypothetical protein